MVVEGSAQELKPGKMIPLFRVPAADVSQLGPWDYKQNKNLVLFFFHSTRCLPCRQLLKDLAKGYSEYPQLNTEVLGISEAAIEELRELQRELGLPFPLLSDMGWKVFGAYVGQGGSGRPETAVFISDRYGALYTQGDRHRCRRVARRKGDPRLAIVYRNPMPRVLPARVAALAIADPLRLTRKDYSRSHAEEE